MLAGSIALLALITVLAFALRRRMPWLIVGWLWFTVSMAPVSGLMQFGRQSMADRYAYLPFIGLYMAMAWTIWDLVRERTWRMASPFGSAAGPRCALAAVASLCFEPALEPQ